MACTIVFRNCSVILPSQEQLEDCPIHHIPLAVHVPMNPEEIVPEGAFAGVPRLRHVSVEPDIRLIGAEAWQNCRQLRIVKLPATVVGIADNVFRDCKLLNSVLAPGCRDFGYKAFAECCSLQWVYASEGVANMFNSEAKFGQYLFQGCINLAEFTLSELPSPRGSALQARTGELTPGCLSSTGITALALTKHFVAIGAHACDSCRLLKSVFFFPRVRTPCGHGAQVIVEGREEQSDGGERNRETQHPTKQTKHHNPGPTGRVSTIM